MHQQTHITGSGPAHQQGVGLLVFFVVLILAGSAFLLTHTPPESGRVQAENRTSEALASAKQALLAYAVGYYSREEAGRHGILPCPESNVPFHNGDGNSSISCNSYAHTNSIGLLPWKTLEIPPLHDGTGECLWYALSGGFYNNPESPMTNDDTPGMFELVDTSGNLLAGNTPEDRVVAVVIAPGAPLAGQTRSAQSGLPCKQSGELVEITDYLESFSGINNTTVSDTQATANQVDRFITATGLGNNPGLNDRIITITAGEIFDAIKKRPELYDNKIAELGLALGECLSDYAQVAALTIDNAGGGPGGPPGGGPPGGGPPGGGPPGGGPPGGGPPGGGPPGGGPPGGGPPGGGGSTLQSCYDDCNAARTLCRLTAVGSENADCNTARNSCRAACLNNTGVADYRLPWPAPVDLDSDYREDDNYIGLGDDSEGYLGRLPFNVADSSNSIGIPAGTQDTLFTECNLAVDNPEMFTLWQHWKDHWFYVLGSDFAPSLTTTPASVCNSDCPQVDGTRRAAVLIFSDERINNLNQLRRTNETEDPNPPLSQSKGDLANYLEGNNFSNYRDDNGNGNYGVYGVNNHNDRLFCINSAMNNVEECTP